MIADTLARYAADRERLLGDIVAATANDPRFRAGWLTGSYGRGDQDALSDLDLTLVVVEAHAATLCRRAATVSAVTTPERHALFARFGEIANLHENNNNAPPDGTFTNVVYAPTAVMVDWVLAPEEDVQRPAASRLLFDHVGIPVAPPPVPESAGQRTEKASEINAFFWMMLAVTIKCHLRGDGVFVATWLESLQRMVREVQRLVAGETAVYQRGSLSSLAADPAAQLAALEQLAAEMEGLMPGAAALGGFIRPSPLPTIARLITLAR